MANDDTTKLVIYGLGIAAVVFFAFMIYRDSRPSSTKPRYGFMPVTQQPAIQSAQQLQPPALSVIEQRLSRLESKIDTFTKLNSTKQSTIEQPDRKTISMTKPIVKRINTKEFFGMQ